MICQLFNEPPYLGEEESQIAYLARDLLEWTISLVHFETRQKWFIRAGITLPPGTGREILVSFFICAKWNFIDISIYRPRLPVCRKIVFSTVSIATISFPLFPAAFQQLILESFQVFHNSNGIFPSCRPLSTTDRSGILHISNCDFITRKCRGMF